MTTYTDHVEHLFKKQGFHTCQPQKNTCTTHQDLKADIVAEQNDTTLLIFCQPHATAKQLKQHIDKIAEISADKTILFTSKLPPEEKTSLEQHASEHSVELSIFQPHHEKKPDLPDNMPSSYEIIGNIAVLNLEDDQLNNKHEIAQAVQQQNNNIQTVLNKTGQLTGDYRIGEYETILGTSTETTHIEHGCRYRLDPTKTYFSERLSHERERIAEQIQDGETIHTWFAGIGPYSILLAKQASVHIHSIELNPHACTYMDQNIQLNNVKDRVTAYRGNVKHTAPHLPQADRIIMPLPGSAHQFLDTAFQTARKGCTVHYYRFSDEDKLWKPRIQEIQHVAEQAGRDVNILHREICGHYAPYVHRVCIDFQVT